MSEPVRSQGGPPAASAWLGVVTVVMTLLGWSSVPLFIEHFSHAIDMWTSNGWRYGFSAVLWAPVLVWAHARGSMPRGLWRAALWPAAFNAAGQAAFTYSFYNIDPATATFGLRLQIVFVALGAYVLFERERAVLRRPAAWAGIAFVIVGIAGTLFLADRGALPTAVVGTTASYPQGVAAAVASGLLFAAYGLSVRRSMHAYHPVTAFAAISQLTAAVMVALMLLLARDPAGVRDWGASATALAPGQFGLLLLSSVIGIALGHVFYYVSIARLGVAVSGAVIQLQPFCVAVAQMGLIGKALTPGQWVSGALAVVGAMMLLWVQYAVSRRGSERPTWACAGCGYDRRGLGDADVCPECGAPVGS